ncbi:hypothetical protein HPP92_010245 [Vanilla planifolia]|uniref:PSII 6.1 kDa protein n=1 Tax=Vanilla planifolia TaxID=51239 RepID=A0A835R3A5_VANPL|nr:hypothetical protein HPP92_010245 [Vanilla planifolia]
MASITSVTGISCISLRPKRCVAGAASTPATSGDQPTTRALQTASPFYFSNALALFTGAAQNRGCEGRVRCSSEEKPAPSGRAVGVRVAAGAASIVGSAGPALALVDERLSTEGTGLSLGISNNLLAWVLLGVLGIIWSLYFIYTSTLEEDEESGLSL